MSHLHQARSHSPKVKATKIGFVVIVIGVGGAAAGWWYMQGQDADTQSAAQIDQAQNDTTAQLPATPSN